MHIIFVNELFKTFFEAELRPGGCVTLVYMFDVSIDYCIHVAHINEFVIDAY